jgi:TRAP-type C4-dicarboxylate transport system substrate-binding protein
MIFPAPRLRAALMAALGWLAAALPAGAQEVTLRLHQFLPAQANVPTNLLHPWADRVEAASNGRFPTTEVFELPFVMTNAKAASQAYWDMFEKHMKDGEFADVHMIATWVHGPGVIHSRQKVEKLDDLKGMKLRAPSRIVNTLLGHLGATPVGMPVPAVTEALSRGVIDGAVVPWEVAPSVKIEELVSHHTEFAEGQALYTATFVLAMNKARYEALPDDLKKVIDDNSGRELSALFGWTQEHYDGPARQLAVDRGNTILRLDADATARWKDAAQPVIDGWIEEMNGRGLDGAALVDEARALIAKYTEAQ